jgi:tetraacyldisaccharide 4'-kinase
MATGRKVIAFAGIGRPEKFFGTLRALKADIVAAHAFADHHVFDKGEIARLKAAAKKENAVLITTEKDFVRLAPTDREGVTTLPIEVQFETPLEGVLSKVLSA